MPSKSSIYDVISLLKSVPFGAPGFNFANSPLTEKLDSTSVSMLGNLFTIRVKNGTSLEKFPLKPKIVLLIGSVP